MTGDAGMLALILIAGLAFLGFIAICGRLAR